MGRHLEFDKDEVLELAMEVFWAKGYEATSLQDLLQAMDLSKSSFYQSFSSKHDLFQRCLGRFRNAMALDILKKLQKAESGYIFIEQFLYDIARGSMSKLGKKGCMIMNTASEFSQRDPDVAYLVKDGLTQMEDALLLAIEQAQREGGIQPSKDSRALARYLVTSIGGLKILAKAGASKKDLRNVVDIILSALK